MIASQPPCTSPTPSCSGVRCDKVVRRTCRVRHLYTSLLSVSPTAMGRCPRLFLRQAKRVAPHRLGVTAGGADLRREG